MKSIIAKKIIKNLIQKIEELKEGGFSAILLVVGIFSCVVILIIMKKIFKTKSEDDPTFRVSHQSKSMFQKQEKPKNKQGSCRVVLFILRPALGHIGGILAIKTDPEHNNLNKMLEIKELIIKHAKNSSKPFYRDDLFTAFGKTSDLFLSGFISMLKKLENNFSKIEIFVYDDIGLNRSIIDQFIRLYGDSIISEKIQVNNKVIQSVGLYVPSKCVQIEIYNFHTYTEYSTEEYINILQIPSEVSYDPEQDIGSSFKTEEIVDYAIRKLLTIQLIVESID